VYKIGGAYRFNRVELLEWATSKKMPVSPLIFHDNPADAMPSLTEALATGGVHYRLGGKNKDGVIRAIVDVIPLPGDADKDLLVDALIARENLGTTAIGDGIAIPHVRNPLIFHVDKPLVALCFLEQAIDFGALDGKPVDIVLTIITNSVRSHLHVLSRLSFALNKEEVRRAVKSDSSREDIFAAFKKVESSFTGAENERRQS
jgi:PTS system nitrogen regulatory IIA component